MLEKILKQYGADKVSARTKISKKNLSKLQKKDFEGFSKPQAYGFVSILQREYGDDFAELKAELEVWFSPSDGEEKKEEIFISAEEGEGSVGYKKWAIAAVLLLAVAAALFYMFQKEQGSGSVEPGEEAAQSRAAAPADGKTAASAASEAAAVEEKGQPPRSAEPADEPAKSGVKQEAEPNEEAAPAKEAAETEPYVPMESAVITPVVKLWFGIIDLESKKRVAKTTGDPYEIDPKGRKLLITGHGRFEISDSFGNLFKYNDAKKHYFLIDDGMVKEIPLSEFKRLNGGKVW